MLNYLLFNAFSSRKGIFLMSKKVYSQQKTHIFNNFKTI